MLNLNCYYETIIATIYRMYHFYVILVLVQMLHACILLQFDHCFNITLTSNTKLFLVASLVLDIYIFNIFIQYYIYILQYISNFFAICINSICFCHSTISILTVLNGKIHFINSTVSLIN